MTESNQWKPRELDILQLMAQGLTNAEIGAKLFLAHDTVRWYNKMIFGKLDVRNRTEAVKRANELGLLGSKPPTQTTNKSPIQYVQNDGIHIAYQVIGEGPVELLFIHGFISHLDVAWENPEFADFFETLGQFARVILFDKRGMGLSDRIQGAPTLEDTVEDAICVLNAVASKRTLVMGTSEGAAAAVLLASTHPERVDGLLLYGATPKVVRSGDEPGWANTEEQFEAMIEKMQRTWGEPWAIESFAPSRAKDERFRAWWAMILRSASSPSSIKAILDLIGKVDIRGLLPQIRVKTLVIHKSHDRLVSRDAGKYFADHMPNAEWLELPGADHIYFVEKDAIVSAVSRFIQDIPTNDPSETRISVILCAHLPQGAISTSILRAEVNLQRARFSSVTEREILATFNNPTQAVQAATGLLNIINHEKVRISLHVGECYTEDGSPLEYVTELSRKATEFASEGEVLITGTLHDILAGSRLKLQQYSERADMILPEDMVLYALTG